MSAKNLKSQIKILSTCLQMIDLELVNSNFTHSGYFIIKSFDDFEYTLLNLIEEYFDDHGLKSDNLSPNQLVDWFCKCEFEIKKYTEVLQAMIEIRSDKVRLFNLFTYNSRVTGYLTNNYNDLLNFVYDLNKIFQ